MVGIDFCEVCGTLTLDAIECPRCGIEVCSQGCLADHLRSDHNCEELSESDYAEFGDFGLE